MTNDLLISLYVQVMFISISFWESHVEGDKPWASGQTGWKIKFLKNKPLTAYHFWFYLVTLPLALMLPFIVFGFNIHMFWLLIASFLIGIVLEDFLWFIVNPVWGGLKNFNSEKVYWHKWLKLGKFEIPDFYIYFVLLGIVIFLFLYNWTKFLSFF